MRFKVGDKVEIHGDGTLEHIRGAIGEIVGVVSKGVKYPYYVRITGGYLHVYCREDELRLVKETSMKLKVGDRVAIVQSNELFNGRTGKIVWVTIDHSEYPYAVEIVNSNRSTNVYYFSEAELILINEETLKEGDRVVVAGLNFFNNGSKGKLISFCGSNLSYPCAVVLDRYPNEINYFSKDDLLKIEDNTETITSGLIHISDFSSNITERLVAAEKDIERLADMLWPIVGCDFDKLKQLATFLSEHNDTSKAVADFIFRYLSDQNKGV